MELDSAATPNKRSRAKAKTAAAESAPRSRKAKKANEPQAQEPAIQVTSLTEVTSPDGEVVATMIATAAYYLAEQRNFEPGHELDDWLEAERQVRALYT